MIDDFVGVFDGVFSDKFCNRVIKYYETCAENNKVWGRTENNLSKADTSVCFNPITEESLEFSNPNFHIFLNEFNDVFWNQCYSQYVRKYSTLESYQQHTIYTYKVQKTLPCEGYHVWHCEDCSTEFSKRIGVYILYLNDVDEGGETEFLYLSKRYSAKKGRLLIFPSNYPWTHRGNPPLSGEKYILTGWIEYA